MRTSEEMSNRGFIMIPILGIGRKFYFWLNNYFFSIIYKILEISRKAIDFLRF